MALQDSALFEGTIRDNIAILRDAPILILDEPAAALDVEAEAEVMRTRETLIEGRTALVISHRLSALGNVDEIIVLKPRHLTAPLAAPRRP